MKTRVERLGKDLKLVKSRLDEVDEKLENMKAKMENLERNVETVKNYLGELREMTMNKEVPSGDWGKASIEQPSLLLQLLLVREMTPFLPMKRDEQMRYREATTEEGTWG